MSISYSGIVGYGKATLPSVDTWGTNMNILQDPPKSIMTRKIDKASESSLLTEMNDAAGDRVCEMIKVYARGVNPFVAVSYNNDNSGQRVNSQGNTGKQSFLPYRLGPEGAFRPPVVAPQSLLPLSRLPRLPFEQITNKERIDFSKKMVCPQSGDQTQGVKKEVSMLRTFIRPTAVKKIETPISEPFEVKYVIKNPIHTSANSGTRTLDITSTNVQVPHGGLIEQPLHADAQSNPSMNKYVNNSVFKTDKYIQNVIYNDVQSKPSRNIQVSNIEDLKGFSLDNKIQNAIHTDYTVASKGYEKNEYITTEIDLERNLPEYHVNTNTKRDIYVNPIMEGQHQKELKMNHPTTSGYTNVGGGNKGSVDMISDRNYRLNPTIQAGGIEGRGTVPLQGRGMDVKSMNNERMDRSRKIMEMQMDRR